MSLLETDVPVRNVVTTGPEVASALENDVRAKLLDMLADGELTVAEIHAELERRGEQKAETTVRHHVDVLRQAGLVEIARLEDAGGGTLRYYKSNTRVFDYDLPDGADETLAPAYGAVRGAIRSLVAEVYREHGDAIETVARETKPCEYCETQRFEEFVVRELVDRALTELGEDGTLTELADRE